MNNNDKLYNLYLQLEPTIAELEEERKNSFKLKIERALIYCNKQFLFLAQLFGISFVFSFPIISIFSALTKRSTNNFSLIIGLLGIAFFLFTVLFVTFNNLIYYGNFSKDYKYKFKTMIINKIISSIHLNLEYESNNYVSLNEALSSRIIETNDRRWASSIHYYTGNDLIQGSSGSIFFQFSEIAFKAEIGDHFFQHRLFGIIDLYKKIDFSVGTKYYIGNKILLDNSEFNELFTVYAENTIEAFYILPSNLLERMVDFVHETGRKFDFSVVDDKFYIAIPYNRPLFEPPIFKSLFDYLIYEEYLSDLDLILGIVEDLKLA